jgi:hypothetical protein
MRSLDRIAVFLGALVLWVFPCSAWTYDYLEHAFFTDLACTKTQRLLLSTLRDTPDDEVIASRYLALSLFCPQHWKAPYCDDGYKLAQGTVNRLESPPRDSHDYSITLGDYAALPDHLSRFGPIRNLPRAGKDGLIAQTYSWLAATGSAGGVIEDVAEDACETDGLAVWDTIQTDIESYLDRARELGEPLRVPAPYLSPLARAPVPKGPADPAGSYSFDNPHYLDLVLRNHHHFGTAAYSTWLGFHSAALQISERTCEETFALEPDLVDSLADDMTGFDHLDWDDLSERELATQGCALLRVHVSRRLSQWRDFGAREFVDPVRPILMSLAERPAKGAEDRIRRRLLDRVLSGVASLVFEASAVHFLQDGLAAGHMRTIRTRGGLQEVRYDHDRDNTEGVVAVLRTRAGAYPFVAFGDTYLLGPPLTDKSACIWPTPDKPPLTQEEVSTCLVQHQRGLLTAATMASLLDWTLGGTLDSSPPTPLADSSVTRAAELAAFVSAHLPSQPTMVAGEDEGQRNQNMALSHGSLPVPPPPFSYESLSVKLGMDVAGDATQLRLDLAFLTELDAFADWMRSVRFGLAATLGQLNRDQWLADVGFHFHWRWAARFTLEAGMSAYLGFRGFKREDLTFFAGLSPVAGLTVLPEGWIKMPLEVSVSYRPPITFLDSEDGFFGRDVLEGNWLYLGFGLAFMR